MKCYWKIMLVCFVIALSIGTFYIQSSFATNNLAEVNFKKISGNEDEVKNLVLFGDYYANETYYSLQFTSEKISDLNQLSLLQNIERLRVPASLEALVKEQKSFMRSKDLLANHFFEDENTVAYARTQAKNPYEQPLRELAFDIELLDKKTKEVSSTKIAVPERDKYSWMTVEDVQVFGDELKIITQNLGMDDRREFHAYVVNKHDLTLVNHYTIATTPVIKNGWADLTFVNNLENLQGDQQLFIQIESHDENTEQDDNQSNTITLEYVIYDVANDYAKNISLPEDVLRFIGNTLTVTDSTIIVPALAENGITVHQYDSKTEKWEKIQTFNSVEVKDDGNPFMKVMNGKLYVVSKTENGDLLFIGNLETGESLYEGKLEVKIQGEIQLGYDHYIYDILEEGGS